MDQQFPDSYAVGHHRNSLEESWICHDFLSVRAGKVPVEYYEASSLDGAKPLRQFLDMTLPSISPTTFFLMIITMVNSLQAYDQIQILTQGGPSGSTRTLLYMYYQLGFEEFKMGQATSVAVIMIVITVLLSLIQFVASKRWVHY